MIINSINSVILLVYFLLKVVFMKILFTKYHANGNDFILVMNEDLPEKFRQPKIINRLCSRRTGIGADGVFIISPSKDYDFFLDYYNADGSWESLCANGSRCAVHFMHSRGLVDTNIKFCAGDGEHNAKILKDGNILMSMKTPKYKSGSISPEGVSGFFVDSGARHFVCESEIMDDDYVFDLGKKIRNSDIFKPRGINVNFYQQTNENCIEIKTYEKMTIFRVFLSVLSIPHLKKSILTIPWVDRSPFMNLILSVRNQIIIT